MAPRHLVPIAFAALLLGLAPGCTPAIGDGCGTALDCSIAGDRTCDLARPGGACTIFGCAANTCPENAVCVRWRPDPSRLSFTACMRYCEVTEHCRVDEGYDCVAAGDLTTTETGGEPIAEVVDVLDDRATEGASFCIATVPEIPDE